MYLNVYYAAYLVLCAVIIVVLARTFRRAGSLLLSDTFGGSATLAQAVTYLLDVGFYLISFGYVGISFRTYIVFRNFEDMALDLCAKLGGFLLLLGFVHFFNLLLMAVIRQRSPRIARSGVLS